MRKLKYSDEIKKGDEYFDGERWVKVYSWMIGQYVAKRTVGRFRRPKKGE